MLLLAKKRALDRALNGVTPDRVSQKLCSSESHPIAIYSMAKHPRKRQRTAPNEPRHSLSVVSLAEDTSKDDEERRLESLLFGVPFVPSTSEDAQENGEDGEEEEIEAGAEMNGLLDTDVHHLHRSPLL